MDWRDKAACLTASRTRPLPSFPGDYSAGNPGRATSRTSTWERKLAIPKPWTRRPLQPRYHLLLKPNPSITCPRARPAPRI
jgi:hypothetical protein